MDSLALVFYDLLQNHIPLGTLQKIIETYPPGTKARFTNKNLGEIAKDLAAKVLMVEAWELKGLIFDESPKIGEIWCQYEGDAPPPSIFRSHKQWWVVVEEPLLCSDDKKSWYRLKVLRMHC